METSAVAEFLMLFGAASSLITVLGFIFAFARWLKTKLIKADEADASADRALMVANFVHTVIERTILVPYLVEKTEWVVEKTIEIVVVPLFKPGAPRPWAPKWTTRPQRVPKTGPGGASKTRPWFRPTTHSGHRPMGGVAPDRGPRDGMTVGAPRRGPSSRPTGGPSHGSGLDDLASPGSSFDHGPRGGELGDRGIGANRRGGGTFDD